MDTALPFATATEERQLRVDLAAAFRLAANANWHESVGNHFSVTLGNGSRAFLMNPQRMIEATLRRAR